LGLTQNGKLHARIKTTEVDAFDDYGIESSIPIGAWTQIKVSYFEGNLDVEINGTVYHVSDSGLEPFMNSRSFSEAKGTPFTLGADENGDSCFTGFLDEISISYQPPPPPLVFMASFEESTGTKTYDSQNGLEGALQGDTAWIKGKIGNGLHFDGDHDLVNFKIPRQMLQEFRQNCIHFFGKNAIKKLALIDKYEFSNPDTKTFSREKFTVENEDYFSDIARIIENKDSLQLFLSRVDNMEVKTLNIFAEKLYWLGFMCGDGSANYENNRIRFKLQEDDIKSVQGFADAVGYKGKIRHELQYIKDTGKMGKYYSIEFRSKQMATDLKALGKFGSKSLEKMLPPIIFELIEHAKELKGDNWMDSNAGMVALLFLFGFHDADGTLVKGRYFTIGQGGKNKVGIRFLEQVKEAFDVPNKVSVKGINENSGTLALGTALRDAMMRAILKLKIKTMKRKQYIP